ncbi:MAG TPA: hypothetical protein VFS21_31280 [Roseiflexaceae bacterium]|nr:hypothetical protein [Roseiflexaceae bacterium]
MAVDYEQAVQALKRRIGDQWSGAEPDGRDEFVDALREELGYAHDDARQVVDAMIQAGTLRYHRADPADEPHVAVPVAPVQNAGAPSGASGTGSNTILPPAALIGNHGYWQIGDGLSGDDGGRKGQVVPS